MPGEKNTVADALSCHPDLAISIEVFSDLMGLICASQVKAGGTK